MKKNKNPMINNLIACVSTDESRPALSGVYLTATHAVTTDGHRMFVTREVPQDARFTGKVINATAYAAGAFAEVENVTFPDFVRIVPTSFTHAVTVKIPSARCKPQEMQLTIDARGQAPRMYLNDTVDKKDAISGVVTLDLALLAPWAGERVCVAFTGSLGAAVVCKSPADLTDLMAAPWFGVVMAMRGGSDISSVQIPTTIATEVAA